jgi:hypothetical protein
MEAVCSSKTSVESQRTTRRYIPEDGTLHNHGCENLKSYIGFHSFPQSLREKAEIVPQIRLHSSIQPLEV